MGRYRFEHLDKLKTPPLPDVKGKIWSGPPEAKREVPKAYRVPYGTVSSQTEGCRDTHPAAPHGGHVPPGGNVTEDREEPKPMWRPCPKCHALPKDGSFRLINIRWGLAPCRVCKQEEREAMERSAFRLKSVDREANRFLKQHGERLSFKRGGQQLKVR